MMAWKDLAINFLKRNWRLSAIVTGSMALIFLILLPVFPDMPFDDALAVSASWPELMRDLFGDPIYSFTDIYGWLYLEIFHITYWIAFGVLASILAANILAKEIEENTIDILLANPISRTEMITSRMGITSLIILAATVIMIFVCALGISIAGFSINFWLLIEVFLSGFLISMVFAALSLYISVWVPKQTIAVFFSLGLMGLAFMYEEVLVKLYPVLDRLSFINPFHYYEPDSILIHHTFSLLNLFGLVILFLVFFMSALVIWNKKDIT